MSHDLLRDSRLFRALVRIDRDLAATARKGCCPVCGGRLENAPFPRKPRGVPAELRDEYSSRDSFSCGRRDCRKRLTPGSVRFFGRRFYVVAVVVVVSAMQEGITEKRVARLRELVGSPSLSARTLYRWREWWLEIFVATPFWKGARARFSPPVDRAALPASLLERFRGGERERLIEALRFLTPLSSRTAMAV